MAQVWELMVAPPRQDPLYQQIAADLRKSIEVGDLPPGAPLPSEGDLSSRYRVSRNTVRLALSALTNEGLVTGGQGRSRTVRRREPLRLYASHTERRARQKAATTDHWGQDVRDQNREPGQSIEVAIVQASPDVAQRLNLKTGETVAVRRRIRTVDGQAWNLNDSYYPLDIVMGTKVLDPTNIPEGVVDFLATLGHVEVNFIDELTTRMPTPDEAQKLHIGPGIPVLVQARTAYTSDRPIRLALTIMPGDRHRLVYELPA